MHELPTGGSFFANRRLFFLVTARDSRACRSICWRREVYTRMAVTRLIPLHINKGKTIAQCLADRLEYGKNGRKTEDGKYISSYECDLRTADEEFLLAKRQYLHITGRKQEKDVIAYQIRQSFKPGEISPEKANEIGYELAKQFTKGRHAFIVATHTDRAHIHNHIYFNSTSLDCKRKFRDFRFSWKALSRISDRICLEHGLSIVEPNRRKSKKQIEHPKRPSQRKRLRMVIDAALEKRPKDFDELIKLLEADGYEFKNGKHPAFRESGKKKFLRLRSLGEGYSEEELRAVISGKSNLLIDIQEKLSQGKGAGYERWAKVFNLKQMAQVMCFLQENGLTSYDELSKKTDEMTARFNQLSEMIKISEKRLAEIAVLRTHIINYSKTRNVYVAYRKAGYSRKFYEAHREEITLHKAAKEAFNQLNVKKIPRVKELNMEYAEVMKQKKEAYAEYRSVRKEMQDYVIARKIAATILEIDLEAEVRKRQEQEKEKDTKRDTCR